ncbi:hypothetical protein ACWJJH_18130 [Endozoicomonadaceae bacterium StTr2]
MSIFTLVVLSGNKMMRIKFQAFGLYPAALLFRAILCFVYCGGVSAFDCVKCYPNKCICSAGESVTSEVEPLASEGGATVEVLYRKAEKPIQYEPEKFSLLALGEGSDSQQFPEGQEPGVDLTNQLLQSSLNKKGFIKAVNQLYDCLAFTRHIKARWQDRISHYSYFDSQSGHLFKVMINHDRSGYSRDHLKQTAPLPYGAKCKLCHQNVGDPANQANTHLRAFDLMLNKRRYFIQTTAYPYWEGHVILIEHEHRPMRHDLDSILDNIALLNMAPEFTVCVNSDIYGAGATIPEHHHVPLLRNFCPPVMHAKPRMEFHNEFCGAQIDVLNWPFTVFRICSQDSRVMAAAVERLIDSWKQMEMAENGDDYDIDNHNHTANYVMRKAGNIYSTWVFLRNVGVAYKAEKGGDFYQIKSEYCGYIDVCGYFLLADKDIEDGADDEEENPQQRFLRQLENGEFMIKTLAEGLNRICPVKGSDVELIDKLIKDVTSSLDEID